MANLSFSLQVSSDTNKHKNLQEIVVSSKEQNKAPRDWKAYVDHYVELNQDEMRQLEIFLGFLRQGFSVQHLCLFSQISSDKLQFAKDRLNRLKQTPITVQGTENKKLQNVQP